MNTTLLRSAAALALLCGAAAHAQQAPVPTPTPTPVSAAAPSPNAMVNLVRALVAKGTLSPTEGQALLDQANAEAAHAAAAAAPPGTVRVPYVPESVRAQIRDELKEDVLQTAKAEGWATPGTGRVQPWVSKVNDWADLTFRIASGDTNSPVSTSSTLGGGFVKKATYIDQAYAVIHPIEDVSLTGGRMPNPFYSYDVIWDPDLNFDGIALAAGHTLGDVRVSGVAGAFPFEYGADSFPTSNKTKQRSTNKWLYAAQLVGTWQARHDIQLKTGAAYYHFTNVQGQVSSLCSTYENGTPCDTDQTRPAFLQKGNTLFAIRNIVGPPGSTNFSQRQFVGLTFDYHILNVNADVTVKLDDAKAVTVGGDYIKNLALNRNDACKTFVGVSTVYQPPINNRNVITPCAGAGSDPALTAGDTAWMARVSIGYPSPKHWGEWNIFGAYKYIESDAVLDSLVDNEFHLGGTNAEGYVIAGTLGLYDNVAARVKYQSANAIKNPLNDVGGAQPFGVDVLQLDLLVAF